MIKQLVFLFSRDIGAAFMVGIITALGITIYSFAKKNPNKKFEKLSKEKNSRDDDNLITLKELHQKGILTEEEYHEKTVKIIKEVEKHKIEQTEEYLQLKSLLANEVLSEYEFNEKVGLLKNRIKDKKHVDELPPKYLSRLKKADYLKIKYAYMKSNPTTLKAIRRRLESILKISADTSDFDFIERIITEYENKLR